MNSDWEFCELLDDGGGYLLVLEKKDRIYRRRRVNKADEDSIWYNNPNIMDVYQ